jgi:hypothetical protein
VDSGITSYAVAAALGDESSTRWPIATPGAKKTE